MFGFKCECFKCLARYLHPTDYNSRRIRKVDELYGDKLGFKDIKFPVKEIFTKLKEKILLALVFFGCEDKKKYLIYVSQKCFEDKHVDLLLIGEGEKNDYVLIKGFNAFMYDYTLHHGRKYFSCYCLQAFRTADVLKCHIYFF